MFLHHFGSVGGRFGAINRALATDRIVPALLVFNCAVLLWALCPTRAEAALSVSVVEARASDAYTVQRAYGGEVRATRSSTLGFRHAGEVVRLHVEEGEAVAAGTLLAELDPEPLEARVDQTAAALELAEANLEVARANLELAEQTTARFAELLESGHTSRQRFDEVRLDLAAQQARIRVADAGVAQARADLRLARVDLDRSRIHAPYDGRVQARFVDEGAILVPGQQVLRLVESGVAEARIGVPTDVASTLEPGARYEFRSGNRGVEGRLLALLPEVDDTTRTTTALFALDDGTLPAGASVELELERAVTESGFWLPLTSLSEAQRGLWAVYALVDAPEGSVTERRLVEVIHTERDRVFVQGTLRDGEQIVATGTQRIVPGQVVVGVAAR